MKKQITQTPTDSTLIFLGLFNNIDKYFDTLLDNPKFIPYNEKIKLIKESKHAIAHYINQYEYLLKFFGEVRNHISHGIKIDGHSFTLPSEHALRRIRQCRDIIVTPPQTKDLFSKKVTYCYKNDLCKNIFPEVLVYTHMPVYDNGELVGIINQRVIAQRFIKNINEDHKKLLDKMTIDALDIKQELSIYKFIRPETNIHEVLDHFIKAKNSHQYLAALFMTEDGEQNSLISGLITPADLAIIEGNFQHQYVQ